VIFVPIFTESGGITTLSPTDGMLICAPRRPTVALAVTGATSGVLRVTTFTVVGVIRSLLAELVFAGVGAGAVALSQLVTAKREATASNRIVTARIGVLGVG
jgi:hypothetical protein